MAIEKLPDFTSRATYRYTEEGYKYLEELLKIMSPLSVAEKMGLLTDTSIRTWIKRKVVPIRYNLTLKALVSDLKKGKK